MIKITDKPQPNGHCATICPHHKGVLIAYYRGPECTDRQQLIIQYWEEKEKLNQCELYPKTGNAVLYPIEKDRAGLIYSYFNDTDGQTTPNTPVERWKYCSNWITEITTTSKTKMLGIENPKPLITQPLTGYLVRCNPIKIQNTFLLPIYHEKLAYGQILSSKNGIDWYTCGNIGLDNQYRLIQPTIWYYRGVLHALARNFTRHFDNNKAWYSYSLDLGHTWTTPVKTNIDNYNNSIVTIHENTNTPWIVWNYGKSRYSLILGKFDNGEGIPYLQLNKQTNASYPNYCFDKNKNLHIIHTESGQIIHHVFTPEDLKDLEPIRTREPEKPKKPIYYRNPK